MTASNRKPSRKELKPFSPLLENLRDILRPEIVVAVGRVSEGLMEQHGWNVDYVRHPSRGGANEFRRGMEKLSGNTVPRTALDEPDTEKSSG